MTVEQDLLSGGRGRWVTSEASENDWVGAVFSRQHFSGSTETLEDGAEIGSTAAAVTLVFEVGGNCAVGDEAFEMVKHLFVSGSLDSSGRHDAITNVPDSDSIVVGSSDIQRLALVVCKS